MFYGVVRTIAEHCFSGAFVEKAFEAGASAEES
jgi:hypothetical protein